MSPKVSDVYRSKFLRATDLPQGRECPVTIDSLTLEKMESGGDEKPVIRFRGKQRGMVLNKTNANVIAQQLGDEMDSWVGQDIILYTAMTQFGGQVVPCLRCRVPEQIDSGNSGSQQTNEDFS